MLEIAPILNEYLNYDEAWLYCATCTHDNKYDWRIPTHDEYEDIDGISLSAYDDSDEDDFRDSNLNNLPTVKSLKFLSIRVVQPVRDKDA
jgi:hypothetical protein